MQSEVIDIANYWKLPSKLRTMDELENRRPMQSNGRRVSVYHHAIVFGSDVGFRLAPLKQTVEEMATSSAVAVKQDINNRLALELEAIQEENIQLSEKLSACYNNGLMLADSLQKGSIC